LVERAVMGEKDLPGTIVRLPMVYGCRDPKHRLFSHLKRMDDNRSAIVLEESFAQWRGCWGYVENVAAAIALAVTDERAVGRIYNVGDTANLSEAERIRNLGRIARWEGEVIIVPKSLMPESWRLELNTEQDWATNTSRIRKELGYSEPISQDEALRRTIDWQRQHPPEETSKWAIPGMLDYVIEDAILASLKL
jgi:nucleoside-diphosphate-sugar epimerase